MIDIPKGCQLDFRLSKGFACITVPVEGRPRLPVQLSTHFFLRILLAGTLLFLAGLAYAQPVPRGEAVFMGVKKSDRVGPVSAIPDGKPDAVFSLTLKPRPAEPVISEIQIRAFSGSPGFWREARTSTACSPSTGRRCARRPRSTRASRGAATTKPRPSRQRSTR